MHLFDGSLLGEFIKRWRDELGFSQGELTEMLGYKNVNFISMIERGAAKIPADRISDFADVYLIPKNFFACLVLKCSYPEIWDLILDFNELSGIADKEKTSEEFNKWWKTNSMKFGLSSSEWEIFKKSRDNEKEKKINAKIKAGKRLHDIN